MFLLIVIDGMRPDGLAQAPTPYIDRLISEGAHTFKARTVMPSVTLPCHTSMLRGVDVPRHGITTNIFTPLARPVESLFDLAKKHGKRTAFFYNWPELRDLAAPESVDVSYCYSETHNMVGDNHVADAACAHILAEDFDFVMVYLGCVDQTGHTFGWMSDEYLEAIEHADKCVEHVVETLLKKGVPMNLILLSDHGGHEQTHGTDSDEDMTIPFLLWGYLVEPGLTIESPVRIFDTAATGAFLLGLPQPREWEGQAVREALTGTPEAAAHHAHHTFTIENGGP